MIREQVCVGRDGELAAIAEVIAGSTTGGVRFVSITGEPGAGKSTIVRRVAESFTDEYDDGVILWARALPWESDVSGAAAAQLLQQEPDVARLANQLHAVWSAGPSVLVVIDDAQHADAVSMRTLITVAGRHRALPVTIVVAEETGGGDVASSTLYPSPGRVPTLALNVEGLDVAAVRTLAEHRGLVLHPAVAERLRRYVDGNARAVVALLDETPRGLWTRHDAELPAPAFLRAEVDDTLRDCSASARAVIEALAILGAGPSLAEIAGLSGVDDVLAGIDDAVGTRLVRARTTSSPGSARPEIRDAAIRAAVVELMGLESAATAHRRAADIVDDPIARLRHRVAATSGLDTELADEVDAEGRRHADEGAWGVAAALYRSAARLTEEPLLREDRIIRSVDALLAAGDCVAAAPLIPAVESLRETASRNATLAYMALLRGRAAETNLRLDRAWGIVNTERDPGTAGVIAQRRELDALLRCRGTELVEWADTAISLAGAGTPTAVEAAAIRELGVAWSGRPQEAMAAYRDLTDTIRYGAQAQRATMGRGWLELGLDDAESARTSLETALSMARLGGSMRITLWSHAWLARVHFVVGEWDQAIAVADAGLDLAATSGIMIADSILNWTRTQVLSLRGEWEAAERAMHAGESSSTDYESMRVPAMLTRANLAEAAADYAAVIRALSPLPRMADTAAALREPGFWPWVDVLANALVVQGRLEDADRLLIPHEELARVRGHRSAQARLGYARGRWHGADGDIHAARRSFDEALELLDGLPHRYDLARVNFAYGQTLRRAGKRGDADRVIGTARDLYLSLGASTYVERCERELKAGGVHASRGNRADAELTPQEEAVVALVIQGMSNREAAAELFISPKTVQYHLTRIYAKLGVRSRAELAASRR